MSFVSSSPSTFRPIPYHQAHRDAIPATFGSRTANVTPTQVTRVVEFVNNLNQDMTNAQIKERLSGLIGPTFLPVSEHIEYKALEKITQSQGEYTDATMAMAARALNVLQNFYESADELLFTE